MNIEKLRSLYAEKAEIDAKKIAIDARSAEITRQILEEGQSLVAGGDLPPSAPAAKKKGGRPKQTVEGVSAENTKKKTSGKKLGRPKKKNLPPVKFAPVKKTRNKDLAAIFLPPIKSATSVNGVKGITIADISRATGIDGNNVGVWISKNKTPKNKKGAKNPDAYVSWDIETGLYKLTGRGEAKIKDLAKIAKVPIVVAEPAPVAESAT